VKRFPSGFLGTVIGFVVFLIAGVLFMSAFEKVTDPWSVSIFGEKALVGTWWGEMRTPTGRRWVVQLDLTSRTAENDFRETVYMGGTARVCDGARDQRTFDLSGNVHNWRGTRFHLGAVETVERRGALIFGDLNGEWAGDEMKMAGSLIRLGAPVSSGIDEAGHQTVSGDPDTLAPVTFNLKRGTDDEFLVACRALGQNASSAPPITREETAGEVPALTQPVNDFAGVLGKRRAEIERAIRALEADTKDEVVVATVRTMAPSTDIAVYSMRLFANHGRGIGRAGADNGVLVFLAMNERQVRITTGLGIEKIINDAVAADVVRRMTVHFRQNRFGDGVLAGVEDLGARLRAARASR
jgi:uncharacterized protein